MGFGDSGARPSLVSVGAVKTHHSGLLLQGAGLTNSCSCCPLGHASLFLLSPILPSFGGAKAPDLGIGAEPSQEARPTPRGIRGLSFQGPVRGPACSDLAEPLSSLRAASRCLMLPRRRRRAWLRRPVLHFKSDEESDVWTREHGQHLLDA